MHEFSILDHYLYFNCVAQTSADVVLPIRNEDLSCLPASGVETFIELRASLSSDCTWASAVRHLIPHTLYSSSEILSSCSDLTRLFKFHILGTVF